MILYENTVGNFVSAMKSRNLINFIGDEYFSRTSRKITPVQKGIWKYTLEVLKQLTDSAGVSPETGIRLDYVMLDTNNRFEIILAGSVKHNTVVRIIEMLSWERVRDTDELDIVSFDDSEENDMTCVHPSFQSISYKTFFSKEQKNADISSCVYLFECSRDAESLQLIDNYASLTDEAPVFFAEDGDELADRVSVFQECTDGIGILNLFHARDQLSSRGIDDFLSGILPDSEFRILTEGQKRVFAAVIKRSEDETPSLLTVDGRAGTGKSMLAIACMAELEKRGRKAAYVSPMRMQCEQLRRKLQEKTDSVFDIETIPEFIRKQEQTFRTYDVLFVDEAQSVRQGGTDSLRIIMESGTVIVCLRDETQAMAGDVMIRSELIRRAKACGKTCSEFSLSRNMRFSGGGSGINWLTHQFQIADTGNYEDWDSDSFRIELTDTPQELLPRLKERSEAGDSCRILLRYDKRSSLFYDEEKEVRYYSIPEYDFRIPVCTTDSSIAGEWYRNDEHMGYAADPRMVMGMEFDHVGVIVGKELGYDRETGELIIRRADPSAENDPKTLRLIKMSYHVMFSRGRKGVFLFIEDPDLREVIRERISYASRRFEWIKELAGKYQRDAEDSLIRNQTSDSPYAYAASIYKAIQEFAAQLKSYSEDQLDSYIYKALSDQCSTLLLRLQSEPMNQAEIRERYQKIIIRNMGDAAWEKLSENGRKCLLSAELTYHDMKDYNQLYDFSSVCVQVSKAVEFEVTERFFTWYILYLEKLYGKDREPEHFLDKIPGALRKEEPGGSVRLLREKEVTLGTIPFITGLNLDGIITDQEAYDSFSAFAARCLLKEGAEVKKVLTRHMKYIVRIKNDYRNKAAHKDSMDVVLAKACLDYVVEVQRTLGQMLDDYVR